MGESIQPMKLIFTIVERGQGALMRKFLLSPAYQVRALWQTMGRGTASSELLNILGIGTPERDVLFALATAQSTAWGMAWGPIPTPGASYAPCR